MDYGMGNLRSVEKAVEFLGYRSQIAQNLVGAEKLIIPGVGAFGAAMERIRPLADSILAFAASGAPLLGICLGQQLLFDRSEELGEHAGLGLLAGEVKYLPRSHGLKVPHMGWSALHPRSGKTLMSDVQDAEQVYFVHSLYTACAEESDVAATADYGIPFAAAVQRMNVFGTQFHPEKSGNVGLRILNRFLEC